MLLGAVGAYDWNGTVIMHIAGETIDPKDINFYDPSTEVGYERLAGYIGETTPGTSCEMLIRWCTQTAPVFPHISLNICVLSFKETTRDVYNCRVNTDSLLHEV